MALLELLAAPAEARVVTTQLVGTVNEGLLLLVVVPVVGVVPRPDGLEELLEGVRQRVAKLEGLVHDLRLDQVL